MAQEYFLHVTGSAPALWPAELHFGLLWIGDGEALEVPRRYPFSGRWGEILSTQTLDRDKFPMPKKLDMVWLSVVEKTFYSIECDLPTAQMEECWQRMTNDDGEPSLSHIVVGMAPYGQVALWLRGEKKSILLDWLRGERMESSSKQLMPNNSTETIDSHCRKYIKRRVHKHLKMHGLPEPGLFDRIMAQYCYRLVPLFEHWQSDEDVKWRRHDDDEENPPVMDHVFVSRCDGTHHKIADDTLMRHHMAGRPERIEVAWHTGKSEWQAYIWLNEELTAPIFERLYGMHRDTRVDLLLHFDPEQQHYELALFRYGMKQPQLLPEDCFQLIVFKNQFENYRTDNYSQPSGAWIW